MTIDEIYRLVQAFASKDQRGFITPAEFNLMARQAELELYNERLQVVMEGSQAKKIAGYYKKALTPAVAEQDILTFLYKADISLTTGEGAILSDYVCQLYSGNTAVDIVTAKNVGQIQKSSLAKPSTDYPVALLSSNSGSVKVSVFPNNISEVSCYYYLYNNKPTWNYVTIAGKPVYDSSNSAAFLISSRCHGELVIKVLGYLGVSIREADLVNYAQNKEAEQDKV
jgi:hypothetical protein